MYQLPHPSILLDQPLKKETFKILVKKKIVSYWEMQLRQEASSSSSLCFFKPEFMSICKQHPLWYSAGSSPSKVSMALVQATMLSGRYRTQSLLSHWHKNINGCCLLAPECRNTLEDIAHILQICPGLLSERNKLLNFTRKVCSNQPDAISNSVIQNILYLFSFFLTVPSYQKLFLSWNLLVRTL